MSLRGELQTMPLADIFQWLGMTRKTGVLEISSTQDCQKFFLNFGSIATATSSRYHTTDSEANVRTLLREALRFPEGRFVFGESALPPEITSVDLKLDIRHLLSEVLLEMAETLKEVGNSVLPEETDNSAAFQPANEFRMAVIGRLLQGQFDLPVLPTVVKKVLDITQREDFSLRTLSNVIMTDQVLTAQIIKYANSAVYAATREVDSLPSAIQRLGAQAVTNIVLAVSLQSLRSKRDIFMAQKTALWKHALACALMARAIAATLRTERDVAFLCALMMDFGKIILLSLIQEVMGQNTAWQRTESENVAAVLHDYHSRVGRMVGEKWNLPPAVLESISYHHALNAAKDHQRYVAIASLSDTLVTYCSRKAARTVAVNQTTSLSPADEADRLARVTAATVLGLSVEQMQSLLDRGPECLAYAQDFLVH